MNISRTEIKRFIKYCFVGVGNTLITLGTIFICKSILGLNPYASNALGYALGLINSFIWNKNWVFRSDGGYSSEAAKFLLGFVLCFTLQFIAVWMLTHSSLGDIEIALPFFTISGYGIATLIGNILYTLTNFVYNKLVTFK